MKLVTVDDLRDGDVLANDVLLEDYTIVLTKGTVIKEPFIEKLRELEVFTVYIEEQQEQEQPAEPQPPKKEPAINAKKQTPKEQPPLSYTEPKIPMEKITILRDDVEEQVRNKIKDILELHVYQRTENLKKNCRNCTKYYCRYFGGRCCSRARLRCKRAQRGYL